MRIFIRGYIRILHVAKSAHPQISILSTARE